MQKTPIEVIKEQVSCVDVMRHLGVDVQEGGRCKSYRPEAENKTSMLVESDHVVDFGAGNKVLDVIDLWCASHNVTIGESIREISIAFNLDVIKNFNPKKANSQQQLLNDAVDLFHSSMTKAQRSYYIKRGLKTTTIDEYKLGYGNNIKLSKVHNYTPEEIKESGILSAYKRYTIPYLHNSKASYMITREDAPSGAKYMKLKKSDWNENAIFGLDSIRNAKTVYITEGIFDALVTLQEGLPCISPITGSFSHAQLNVVKQALKGKLVKICFDYDPKTKAGQKFTWALADTLLAEGLEVELIFIEGQKEKIDLNDIYIKEKNLKILEKGRDAIFYKIDNATGTADIKELLTLLAKTKNNADIMKYFTAIVKRELPDVTAQWLKEVWRITQEYSELSIVTDTMIKHHVINLPNENFFMYNEEITLWEEEQEEFVSQLIIGESKTKMTGSKIRSATHLAKVIAAKKKVIFNSQKNWLSVKNGLVNINTMEIRDRVKDDFISMTTDYDFDPNSNTDSIENFLFDVANGDPLRVRLLKQIMGYCITKEIKYHKAFILYGKGRNGKSVFLNMLSEIVGQNNVSNIPIHGLDESFQVVNIKDKMINISTEVNADNNAGTDVFKKIVAGDVIIACKKNKDFIKITPFAKLIFATNKIMSTNDTSEGYMDRLMFIDFPCKYVDTPDPAYPNQKQKDEDYYKHHIGNNISGALKVAIEGLADLNSQGKFVETEESKLHTEDIKRLSSQIYSWANDNKKKDKAMSMDDMYSDYREWARNTGSGTLSKRRFMAEVKETLTLTKTESYMGAVWRISW